MHHLEKLSSGAVIAFEPQNALGRFLQCRGPLGADADALGGA